MKRSKWFGLWNNSEKHYMVSQPIKINDLKQFTESDDFRLILKKNKYYEKGTNRPYYNFAIGNCYESADNSITSKDMQYDDIEDSLDEMDEYEIRDYIEQKYDIRLYTYSELRDAIHEANYDGTQHITDIMVEDYIGWR